MYYELAVLIRQIAYQRAFWKDGEVWTALAGGILAGCWFYEKPALITSVRLNFQHILTVSGIVLGFALSVLIFYVQAVVAWSRDESTQKVAAKLIDWHVWSVVCLLVLVGYTLLLWSFGWLFNWGRASLAIEYGILVFLIVYCGCQILNHALTVWWVFGKNARLRGGPQS